MPAIFAVSTKRTTELVNITKSVQQEVSKTGIKDGVVLVFVPHTTAAVTINEAADPSVRVDIADTINELVPWERVYGHAEGNSPAHIKSSLVGTSETVILESGRLALGTWQGIFLCEFDGPRSRQVFVKVMDG